IVLQKETVSHPVPYVAPVTVRFAVAPLARCSRTPLRQYIVAAGPLYSIRSSGKGDENVIRAERMGQRAKRAPAPSGITTAVAAQPVIPGRHCRAEAKPGCQPAAPQTL